MRHVIKKGVEKRADAAFEIISMEVCPIGGGYAQTLKGDRLDEIEEFDPYAPEYLQWIPGLFLIDISEDSPAIRGFHKRQRWNGCAVPVLLDEDIVKLAKEWNAYSDANPEYSGRLEKRGDVWWMLDANEANEAHHDGREPEWEECKRYDVEFMGTTYECWDIGGMAYTWSDLEFNWIALPLVQSRELPLGFGLLATSYTCTDKKIPVEQPPVFLKCWIPCTGCNACKAKEA